VRIFINSIKPKRERSITHEWHAPTQVTGHLHAWHAHTACLLLLATSLPVSTSGNQSCYLLPPEPVFTSSNQSCSTEHEGERGECAARPNYFLSAKSTLRVHEPLLVPCKIFTLPDDRLQLVELTSTSCWAPESKPEHTSWWAPESKPEHTSHWAERQQANQRTRRKRCSSQESTVARVENTVASRITIYP
jgi:hypothetical protein